jgi:protein subunit release factor B
MNHCWLQITSGRGPDECAYFVGKLLPIVLDEAKKNNLEGLFNFEVHNV